MNILDKKNLNKMYYLIIWLPLMSAIIAGFGGRFIGEKGAGILTTSLVGITSLFSWISLYEVGIKGINVYLPLWTWFETGFFKLDLGLMFDTLTVMMLVLVTTVSCLVHLYSTEYMRGDPHLSRFMSYLSLFTFAMIILVTADNYLQMFIGWEGVGICSYLLINFWFTRIQANKSAMQAMIMNRIGDVGLCLGMFIIYYVFKSLDYNVVFSLTHTTQNINIEFLGYDFNVLTLIGILLLIGAIGKSAQLGLHTWLPEAMEGPTPVSALIHAATMVTAGVFLLIRSSPLLEYTPTALSIIVIVGSLTAFFAASLGLVQNDIKKVIAYSTCSQLGYMVLATGLSNYSASIFHLFNHGFFKAGLFLSAGSIIHAVADEQDMRKYGSLIKSLPFTYSVMLIASLSLMGFPFLTGFYSKDAILELAYAKYSIDGTFAHWLGTISALFTAFYSFRLLYLTFINNNNSSQEIFKNNVHESPWPMSLPLGILAIGSIFIGYLFRDAVLGLGTSFFGNSIFILPTHSDSLIDAEFIDITYKWLPVIFSLTGAILAFILYNNMSRLLLNLKISTWGQTLYVLLTNKWHINQIYNNYIGKPLLNMGHEITYKTLDRGYIELVGPLGIIKGVSELTKRTSSLQSGWIYNYAFTILVFATILLVWLGLSSHETESTSWMNMSVTNTDLLLVLIVGPVLQIHSIKKANGQS